MADPEQTWSTIRAPNGGGVRTVAMAFAAFHKDLTKYEVRHPFFAPAFLRATDLAIRAAFAGHDPLARALCAELFPFARAVADTPAGLELDILDAPNLAALALSTLAEAMGWQDVALDPSGPEATRVLTRLANMADFSDEAREGVVLALLVFGHGDKARAIADLAPLPPFLGALLSQSAAGPWPTWRDDFPKNARENKVSWHQLLFAVRLLAPKGANAVAWLQAQVS